jgi:hypothetical protein
MTVWTCAQKTLQMAEDNETSSLFVDSALVDNQDVL